MGLAETYLNTLTENTAAHKHTIKDNDTHFIIDPDTRKIDNASQIQNVLMQYDHNSEVYTFDIPRYIDGHDMLLCNIVLVHYNNIDSNSGKEYTDVAAMTDLAISKTDSEMLTSSWCIARNATQAAGTLNFLIQYMCVDDEGNITYEWHTDIYDNVIVNPGRKNSKAAVIKYSNILEQWYQRLFNAGDSVLALAEEKMDALVAEAANQTELANTAIEAKAAATLATIPDDYTTVYNRANEGVRTKADAIVRTIEGDVISVDDGSDDYLRDLRVFGKTTQFTTTGKNLLPNLNGVYGERNGLTFTDLGNGKVGIVGTATANTTFVYCPFDVNVRTPIAAGTYTVSGSPDSTVFLSIYVYESQETTDILTYNASLANGNSWTFTLEEDAYYGAYLYIGSGKVVDTIISAQLEAGSTATSYEPYTGGLASPNPEWPQDLVSAGTDDGIAVSITGKNLAYFGNSLPVTRNGVTFTLQDDGTIKAIGTPTVSGDTTVATIFGDVIYKKNLIMGRTYSANDSINAKGLEITHEDGTKSWSPSVTIDETVKTIQPYIQPKASSYTNGMIFKPVLYMVGDEPDEFDIGKPIQNLLISQTLPGIPVPSDGNYTDSNGQQWICDEIDFERSVYVQRIGTKIFDGSDDETWYEQNPMTNTLLFRIAISDSVNIGNVVCWDFMCSHFSIGQYFNIDVQGAQHTTDQFYFRINRSALEDESLDGFRALLSTAPMTVNYQLATPIETTLTAEELDTFRELHSNYPNTVVFNNSGVKMELKYNADTQVYLTNYISTRVPEVVNGSFDPTAYSLPILYLTGDTTDMSKDNAVSLSYVYGENSGSCTLKWQGNSSLAYDKKNYTIKFDNEFEAAEGWGAQKKYCLKANYIDFSHARNVVNAKLWGQIVKSRATENTALSALPNGGAVDGFPVMIIINGEYTGLYTFNIPKDGWMYGMGSGTQEAIVCADAMTDATLFNADATLDGDFELEYVTDEDSADWVLTSLNTLINAVKNNNSTSFETAVSPYLDLDSAIDYYIFTVLLRGYDMVGKNYILHTYDGTKWAFGAYDMDCTYGLEWDGSAFMTANTGTTFTSVGSNHILMSRLKKYMPDAIKARFDELRSSVMSEDNLVATFTNFIGQIPKAVYDEECKVWPVLPNTSVNNLFQIQDWYRRRCIAIDAEVADIFAETETDEVSNLVTTSIDTDGSIYNGTGYMDGYRFKSSSGDEVACDGSVITGYIACQEGDKFKVSGVEWGTNASIGFYTVCGLWDSSFAYIGGNSGDDPANTYVVRYESEETGDGYIFYVNDPCAFIRFSMKGSGADMVVTKIE